MGTLKFVISLSANINSEIPSTFLFVQKPLYIFSDVERTFNSECAHTAFCEKIYKAKKYLTVQIEDRKKWPQNISMRHFKYISNFGILLLNRF